MPTPAPTAGASQSPFCSDNADCSIADGIESNDLAGAQLLRAVSPHWLRHAYARTLVVDQGVLLAAAQALFGHASVQTTTEYA